MKKLLVLAIASIAVVGLCSAQEKAYKAAKKYYSQQKWSDAASTIDAVVQNPETVNMLDAWMLRGKIYLSISNNPLLARDYPNAAESSKESFERALQIDPSDKTLVMLRQNILDLSGVFYDRGANQYEQAAYDQAVTSFETSLAVSQLESEYDTSAAFNVALCAFNAAQYEKAVDYAKIVIASTMANPNVYAIQAESYFQSGKKDEAVAAMEDAIARFPEDKTVYTSASSVFLRIGLNEKASEVLNTALEKWGDDASFQLFIGIAYENDKQYEKAEAAYRKALEINPEYMDAIFDLGAFYVNQGIRLNDEANALPLEETEKYDQLRAQANASLNQALPYLQQVIEKQPENLKVMMTLRDVYVQLGKAEEAKALREKIEALQGE
ncbi:MAG: tetratricopeptide repeat protein [Bacteroides sp.]|nr:tetratricopeptide repeat protein [Ruminococcus flavefaciens]MCM1553942.1 tetratricopeptide repeat protein [Bacteroides sp.]